MALPPLKVRIGADTAAFDRAMGASRKAVNGFAVAASAAFVAVGATLAALTVKGLAAVDANTKLARSMDGTANGLRAVQIAAGYSGVALSELNTSAQQLNRELSRATREATSPAAEALDRLGLSAEALSRMDVDKRFETIADRVKRLGLSAGETSDIMRDLGVRSRDMALLLTQGGDAIRSAREEVQAFGLSLDEEQTAAVERANDAVDRMKLVLEGLAQQLAVNVAPVLENVANRFNELAASEEVQAAVERLADAFGRLAEVVLTGNFLQMAIGALENLANVSATVADGMVTFAQNVEIATIAAGGLAAVVIALGGPFTIIAGLLTATAVGLGIWAGKANEAAGGGDAAQEATDALNAALGVFHSDASPKSAKAARDLARANLDIKKTALQAAQAEILKNEAIAESEFRVGNVSGGPDAVDVRLEASKNRASALREEIAALERLDETLSAGVGRSGVAGPPGTDPVDLGTVFLDPDEVEEDLEVRGGFNASKEAMEEAHLARMAALQEAADQARRQGLHTMFSDLSSLMRTENDKLFKIGQAAAIANATVSGYKAAVEAWEWGMGVGGPPLAAAATAASLAKTGALIASIASASPSGGGGGGSSGGGGGAGVIDTQRVDINIVGGTDRDRMVAQEIISVLNGAQRDGFRLDPRLIGAT